MAPLERGDTAADVFTEKNILSPFSSPLPVKAEIMPCLAKLHAFLCWQRKDKYRAVSS